MSAEEVVDRNIPLAAELEPVAGIPPVRVEMSICKAGDLGKRAQDVLPDDEEHEQEGDHEWEEHQAGCFGQDESFV